PAAVADAPWRSPASRCRRARSGPRAGEHDSPAPQGCYAARRRRAAATDGSAAFAFAKGRALTVTEAGFGPIVISSPVAGLRPLRAFVASLTRTVSCTTPPIFTFSASPS